MAYAEVAELKAELQGTDADFDRDDDLYEDVLDEATQAIDNYCHRSFDPPGENPTTRHFRSSNDGLQVVNLDDIANATSLAVQLMGSDGSFTATTDFYLVTDDVTGVVQQIRFLSPIFNYRPGAKNVKITANFGWTTIPTPVHRACIILARRYYVRKESPQGVLGFDTAGVAVRLPRLDPDVGALLGPYIKYGGLLA